jgi:hypothetical protein
MRSIVGTWRLAAAAAHDGNGQPLPPPYGAKGSPLNLVERQLGERPGQARRTP